MTARSAQHGTIRLERRYKAAPARVFAAWAEPEARAKWDVPGRWVIAEQTFDFREGGRERKRFGPRGRSAPRRRHALSRHRAAAPHRVQLFDDQPRHADLGVAHHGRAFARPLIRRQGTHLLLTEQIVFLDGNDNAANREEGLASMLDKIGETLSSAPSRS